MKLIVGLGNPGEKYRNNRHNVGYMLVDFIANQVRSEKLKIKSYNLKFKIDKYLRSEILRLDLNKKSILFIKPRTFMNKSGLTVKSCVIRYTLNVTRDLFIVHDDLDLHLGDYKIQRGKGPRLHNGLLSIEKKLKTKDFWRVRIGVDNRLPGNQISGEEYVLSDFSSEEFVVINQTLKDAVGLLSEKILKLKTQL